LSKHEIKEIIYVLEEMAPLPMQRVLICGITCSDQETRSQQVVCHDALETIIDEAIAKNAIL
jgi:hypothetical protein